MKILFATPHLFPDVVGGSGLHSFHLVRYLAAAGHRIDVLHPFATLHFEDLPQVQEYLIPSGSTVMDFAGNVNRWVGSRQYDLGYSDGLSLARYIRRKSFPVIVNDHGLLQFQPQYFRDYLLATPLPALKDLMFYWPRIWARSRLARRADYVVTMGGKMDELVGDQIGIPSRQVLQLPNAVAAESVDLQTQDYPGDPDLFLFVGKIEFRKGVTSLLKAFECLLHTGARLRMVGTGPLAQRVRHCGLANVELVGPKFGAELRQEYQAAGTFLLPSLQEGMPTVVMEAMYYGRPVITTDVGANRLLVSPGTGLLIEPHDFQAIVQAVRKMMALDEVTRNTLGRAGQRLIQTRYTWDRVAPRYIHSFSQAAGQAASPSGADLPVQPSAGA